MICSEQVKHSIKYLSFLKRLTFKLSFHSIVTDKAEYSIPAPQLGLDKFCRNSFQEKYIIKVIFHWHNLSQYGKNVLKPDNDDMESPKRRSV